jgi:protein-tyrosine phosphatase
VLDIHSHILPGLDDGAADLEEAVELAAEAAAAGVETIVATPHVRSDYPTASAQIAEGVRVVTGALASSGTKLDVLPGAEVSLDSVPRVLADGVAGYTLGGTGRYLLVEFPYEGWPRAAELVLADLAARGVTAVLAHPERNDTVQESPSRLRMLLDATGAIAQVTVGSLDGRFGTRTKATAHALVDLGLAHVAASDAHRPGAERRVWQLPAEIPAGLAEWLTVTVPRAILQGHDVPDRPAVEGGLGRVGRRLLRNWSGRLTGRAQPSRRETR